MIQVLKNVQIQVGVFGVIVMVVRGQVVEMDTLPIACQMVHIVLF